MLLSNALARMGDTAGSAFFLRALADVVYADPFTQHAHTKAIYTYLADFAEQQGEWDSVAYVYTMQARSSAALSYHHALKSPCVMPCSTMPRRAITAPTSWTLRSACCS